MTELGRNIQKIVAKIDELIFVQVIFRHGKRNIMCSFPNDPYKDEVHWPGGYGALTNEGKRQLYQLGQYFRRRYDKILGPKYSPNKIYIRSTDFDRTIMSAQAALAGLFPPDDEEKWHDEILWQPIPVHTVPMNIDHVLAFGKHFPEFAAARDKYLKESPEVQRIYEENDDYFQHLSKESGSKIETLKNVCYLYDTLIIEKQRNKILADWAEDAIKPDGVMENIMKFYYKIGSNTRELARLKSGPLIKEIFDRFSQKIHSTLQPDRSVWLYSAHDFTISNALNSLGLFETHIPPTAASLHFELYKSAQNDYYIQIFYRKSNEENPLPMKIPGCGEKSSLDKFHELYKDIIPEEKSCDSKSSI